uniref:glucuronosyltransferase n=1 Tax=Meloidogyne javanica TaxID=6303 RepID=A0A915LEN1_MELJA
MLVYTRSEGEAVESRNFQVIHVPINDEVLSEFETIDDYRDSGTYSSIGIYKEIITNENGILDWLQRDEYNNFKKYDIGIAEFNGMAGSFAVFEALGIEETFDVSCSIFLTAYLPFLGINVLDYQVPQYSSAKPGDWKNGIWLKDREENEREHKEKSGWLQEEFQEAPNLYNSLFKVKKIPKSIKKPSTLENLFNKVKYHFINQHPLIKFDNFPKHDKFVYIGGITVEDNELLIGGKQMVENESIYAGVPLICIPLAGDQMYIASIVEAKEVGIYLEYENLENSTECLRNALLQILNFDEYGNLNFN